MATLASMNGPTQVNSVHISPTDSNLMATASNDWTVRLNDVRMLGAAPADSKGMCFRLCYAAMVSVPDWHQAAYQYMHNLMDSHDDQ